MTDRVQSQLSLEQQVRLANMALTDEIKLVTIEGQQMAKIGSDLLDETKMNEWFSGLIQALNKQGLELTENGLGRIF